jgi:GAF domain-containing protein
MRKDRIFFTLNEINEALSASNDPRQIVNLALNVLSKVLNVDASWVYLADLSTQEEVLTASRGLSNAQTQELLAPDLRRILADRMGLGDLAIIPDISHDEYLAGSTFVEAGFGSLVVVPLVTSQVKGILGTMWRVTKGFDTDYGFLLLVIGNLICSALERAALYERMRGGAEQEPEIKYDIEEFEKLVALAEKYSRATRLAIEEAVVRAKGTGNVTPRSLEALGEKMEALLSGGTGKTGNGESGQPPEAGPAGRAAPGAGESPEVHQRRMKAFARHHPVNVRAWP